MTNHVRSYGILFPSCAIAVLFLAAPASAQWVVPGASGVPDESSATAIMFNDNGTVSLKSGVTGAHLRYPVVNAKGLDWAPTCGQVPDGTPCSNDPTALCMRTTIRDTGTNARVVVKLQEIPYWFPDNAGSRVNTLMTIDSDTAITEGSGQPLQGSTDYRMAALCANSARAPLLDFWNNAYFVDVTLTRSSTAGNPGVKALRLAYEQ